MTGNTVLNFSEIIKSKWLLFAAGVIAPAAVFIIILTASLDTPGFDPVSQTVSRLVTFGSPYAGLIIASFIIYGIMACALGAAFYGNLSNRAAGRQLAVLLVIHGVFIALTGLFHDIADPRGTAQVAEDAAHNFFAVFSYLSLVGGQLVIGRYYVKDRVLRPAAFMGLSAAVLSVSLPVVLWFQRFESVDGLTQRLCMLASSAWLVFLTVKVLRSKPEGG